MGSLIGSGVQANGDQQAAKLAETGFNYAKSSPLATTFGPSGAKANNVLSQLLGTSPMGTAQANYDTSPGYQFVNATGLKSIGPGVVPGVSGGPAADAAAAALNTGNTGINYFQNALNAQTNLSNTGANSYATIAGATNPNATASALMQGANAQGQAAGTMANYFGSLFSPSSYPTNPAAIADMYSSDVPGQQAAAGAGLF